MKYKMNSDIIYSCKYHVVWCSKYRRKVLVDDVAAKLKELIFTEAAALNVDVIELDVMPDHVHLLIEVAPQLGIHRAVKSLKARTSFVLKQEFKPLTTKLPSLWTNSYFVATVGGASLSAMTQFIESQKKNQRQ